METLEYLRAAMRDVHKELLGAMEGLDSEQLHFRPLDKGNHIAFIIWHAVRTEDSVINFLIQKKPPVWNAEGWDQKFGMDPRAQGTGMTPEQAAAIRIEAPEEFRKYMENTFKASLAYLDGLKEEDLDEERDLPVLGRRNLRQAIAGIVLNHNVAHLGEISYNKGLQGLQGSAY